MLNNPDPQTQAPKREAVVIKKYANRRLYNTETSTYVTLDDLAKMVRGDRDFVVYDAKNGDDLTHAVLTQIIVEQESREGGQALLPIPFLRQLIRFYDDSIARMVPSYLQFSLEHLAKEQVRFREQFASAFANPAGRVRLLSAAGAAEHGDVRAGDVDVGVVRRRRQWAANCEGNRRPARGNARDCCYSIHRAR